MIFTILKVIGIILLVVLALILTALLCVLFVPVKVTGLSEALTIQT